MEDKIVQVSYVDFETGKSFIIIPKKYRSDFNKLTLVHDEFEIYCEPIEILSEYYVDEYGTEMLIEYFKQESNKYVNNKIYDFSNSPY